MKCTTQEDPRTLSAICTNAKDLVKPQRQVHDQTYCQFAPYSGTTGKNTAAISGGKQVCSNADSVASLPYTSHVTAAVRVSKAVSTPVLSTE